MGYIERFARKMELSGNSLRKENILNSRNLYNEVFNDDVSITKGMFFWELGLSSYENKEPLKIRCFKRKSSDANGVTMKFNTMIDTPIETGDVLYNAIKKEYWICKSAFNVDDIHYSGELVKCNWLLKWQLEDGTIVEYPCQDMNSTQYNSGETSNRQFTIGTSQHLLTLPFDKNTVELAHPQRFYLSRAVKNPVTYIVSQNDTTSYNYGKGLCMITVTQCVENSDKDRPDLGICDYFEIKSSNSQNMNSLIIYDTNILKSGGDTQIFKGVIYNENNEEVECQWDIICDFKDSLNIITSDNEIKISIDDDRYVDEEFLLILTDTNGENRSELIIKVESLL